MSEEMISRVASAILKARFYDYEPDAYGNSEQQFFAEIDPDHVAAASYEARAAIQAMSEPTPRMVQAAAKSLSPGRRPTPERVSVKEKHRIRYRAMIAAAIGSQP